MRAYKFKAKIEPGRGGGACVRIPFDVRREFGTGGQVKVKATFDGCRYRGSNAPVGGGQHVLGPRKDIRTAIGKNLGDTVTVVLSEDTEPRIVAIPAELPSAFERRPEARKAFDVLSYTHQREYPEWIAGAKKGDTRGRRVAKTIEQLLGRPVRDSAPPQPAAIDRSPERSRTGGSHRQ